MWPKIQIQDGGRRCFEFYQKCDVGPQWPSYGNVYMQIKFGANLATEIWPKNKKKTFPAATPFLPTFVMIICKCLRMRSKCIDSTAGRYLSPEIDSTTPISYITS